MASARRCPLCGAAASWEGNPFRPFCSERCKLIDLGRWLGEQYRVPIESADDDAVSKQDSDEDTD